jgi:hypothetical protein
MLTNVIEEGLRVDLQQSIHGNGALGAGEPSVWDDMYRVRVQDEEATYCARPRPRDSDAEETKKWTEETEEVFRSTALVLVIRIEQTCRFASW